MQNHRLKITTALCLLLLAAAPATAGESDGRFDIYWIDVEGGAATLIVSPAGESILVDSGNPGHRDPDRIVKVATEQAGLRKIDHLITTHYHRDHYGGAATLATMLPIGAVHDNGRFDGMPDNPGKAYFEFSCVSRHAVQPNDVIELRSSAAGGLKTRLRFLGGRKQFVAPPQDAKKNEAARALHKPKDRDGSDNGNSLVSLVSFGDFRFFDGGDLTWNQEFRLVYPCDLVGPVDVYQVTHHGLASSNNPAVLRTLAPHVAIMNNGVTKGCLPEVFANLQATPSLEAVYQVHKNLRPDGAVNNAPDEYIANHERACQANFIKLSVAADGKSYTITIPANGHRRTYQTKTKP